MWTTKKKFLQTGLIDCLLIVLLLWAPHLVFAHSSEGQTRYVSTEGKDQGDCTDTPCLTIMYTIKQAQKGDQILVADGVYPFDPNETSLLLNDLIPVQGGFAKAGLVEQTKSDQPTYVTGPSHKYRTQLAEHGLTLLQDPKGIAIEQSIQKGMIQVEAVPQNRTPCQNGKAGPYPCKSIDFLSQMPLDQFTTNPTSASDIWGFVDQNDNKEYAIIGLRKGTAVVDVSNPENPKEVGIIPGRISTWRDIKVFQKKDAQSGRWKAYAYVTSEDAVSSSALQQPAIPQGLQIIDLTKLPHSVSLADTYTGFKTAHNIYIGNVDYETGAALPNLTPYVFILGSNLNDGSFPRGGAFRVLDLQDPTNPVEITAPPMGTEYVHDATSLVIQDDPRTTDCKAGHNPCELFIDYNEDTVDIWDMTDKSAPEKISSTGYPESVYVHSGWWTEDKRHLFIQDELDEQRNGSNTTLRVMDISDLTSPVIKVAWQGSTEAIDHNGFVKGNRYYMSNYRRGLTILDTQNPELPTEVAFFDTFPQSDSAQFSGAWGVYPYLPSGTILVSDIQGGLFVLKESATPPQDQEETEQPTQSCRAVAASAQFPWSENRVVSGNSNIMQTKIHLDQEMVVHIHGNASLQGQNYLSGLRMGFYNHENPNQMWTHSYRPIEINRLQEWKNVGSTFSIQLSPGDHNIYWKVWVSGGEIKFSSASLEVEAFCVPRN